MTRNSDTNRLEESFDDCDLGRSERNRYFHGKLMTARDMAAEQAYHRGQFTRNARHVTGYGVVDGLEATVKPAEDGLAVTVQPGYAIDCCGRPVVVPTETTERIESAEIPDAERVGLFIDYAECVTETVPIPGSEDACERECAYNRVLETFELRVDSTDRAAKPVPPVEFPSKKAFGDRPDQAERAKKTRTQAAKTESATDAVRKSAKHHEEAQEIDDVAPSKGKKSPNRGSTRYGEGIDPHHPELTRIARSWDPKDPVPIGCADDGTHSINLGVFRRSTDGTRSVDPQFRPQVYTNDMLYSAIARHTADFENPHEVSLAVEEAMASGPAPGKHVEVGVREPGGPTGTIGLLSSDDSVDISADRQARTVDFSGVRSQYEEYLLVEKSLWNKLRAVTELFEILVPTITGKTDDDNTTQEIGYRSYAIMMRTGRALREDVHEDPEEYRKYLLEPAEFEDLGFDIPDRVGDDLREMLETMLGIGKSIVELEAEISELLEFGDVPHPTLLADAVDTLEGTAEDVEAPLHDARDLAVAEDRVAEALHGVIPVLRLMQTLSGGGGQVSMASSEASLAEDDTETETAAFETKFDVRNVQVTDSADMNAVLHDLTAEDLSTE